MSGTPFLHAYTSDGLLAWKKGTHTTCATFLADVETVTQQLPNHAYVLNLCEDRYWFLVGFAAALRRKHITLLPPSRVPKMLTQIGKRYRECYCLVDEPTHVEGLQAYDVTAFHGTARIPLEIPAIPEVQVAAIAFTSGSTGEPRPNVKTWGALVSVAHKTHFGLGLDKSSDMAIVATVPQQHMYGLETSIMLPMQYGLPIHSGRPFFPEDVRQALSEFDVPRMLITTPLHIRACVVEKTNLPTLACIVSATAPLSLALATKAEKRFHAPVLEIYGFAEAGTIAIRRPVVSEQWQLLEGLTLIAEGEGFSVKGSHLPDSIPIPDRITVCGSDTFVLHGRPANLVNIAGRRVSLDDLNYRLNEIDGIRDGVFFMPDEVEGQITRLVAFVVAPGKTTQDILEALRNQIDPAFIPRPLYLVDSLPRNSTGKLPRESLEHLLKTLSESPSLESTQTSISDR